MPVSFGKKSNAAPKFYKVVRGFGLLNKLRCSSQWDKLSPLFPEYLKKIGNQMAEKKEEKGVDNDERIQVYQELTPLYRDYICELETISGRSFTEWLL